MNQLIKELLNQCKVARIPEYTDSDDVIVIDKIGGDSVSLVPHNFLLDRYYVIRLQRYLIYPPENFNLNTNWNNGINPKSEYMLVTPIRFIGKMIQFDGCGYDWDQKKPLEDAYSGLWLPGKSIEIIQEMN